MKRISRHVWTALAAVLLTLRPPTAAAACPGATVSTLPVLFGTYSTISGSPTDAAGQVTVVCTPILAVALSFTIKLGTGGAGTFAPRRLSSGANTLAYNLYTNSSRTTVWGDGSGGTSTISRSTGLTLLVYTSNDPVYGRIPALQNAAPGIYGDSVVVTVEY